MSLRPTIQELSQLGHHQSLYDWGIQFYNLPQILGGNFTSADLNTRCQTATIPSRSMEPITINLRGHKVFQHGIVDYKNQLQMTLYETQDSKVQEFLGKYMDMQWTPITGSQVPKSLNQCCFVLTLLTSENEPTFSFNIIGAWLESYEPSGSLGSESAVLSWTANWRFDYFI